MFFLLVVLNAYSQITGFACLICLVLMFFESAFGICLGCKLYRAMKKGKCSTAPGKYVRNHKNMKYKKFRVFNG